PELIEIAEKIYGNLSKDFIAEYDASGSIGKRYLRSMISGTPFAVTIDYDSIKDKSVTVRDRDTEKQERVKIIDLVEYISKKLQ
ncbi:MAG: His/Gly/Thr/Pro-type tRNA ligase C-terminal domain-containing protein, partial [Nanoarchaeota archaeon]